MTVLNVEMNDDGSAVVTEKFNGKTSWSWDQLTRAIDSMRECCASRRGLPDNCPCLACEVGKVAKRWRAELAQ